MSLTQGIIMFAAAFCAGVVNSIAGGGTLITFPALIWLGLDAKVANATSTVALWPGLMGSLWGYRREMASSRPYLLRLGLVSLAGGVVGTVLLIATPTATFARLVPYLILFATLLFTLQEPVSRRLKLHPPGAAPRTSWWIAAMIFQFLAAIYGAYFGAGNGILILAVLGLLGLSDIHLANGIKTFLAIALNSVAVIGFALSHLVDWPTALLMTLGAIAGGYFGANVARRAGRVIVRRAIIAIGLAISLLMLWRVRH
jgi:hypothetical protein